MRATPIIVAISMGLALAACGKKSETTTATTVNSDMNASMSNTAAPLTPMPAQQFTDTVAGSDMFEIQSGKLAETMGSTAAVKAFGKQLVKDHTDSSDRLKAMAGKTKPVVALPLILPADLKAKLAALKATSGPAFDKLFVEQQIEGHQKALDALHAYAAGGDQPALQDFATGIVPIVQGHLTALQGMPK